MKQIEEKFLDAFRCAVNGTSTDWEEEMTVLQWKQLFQCADRHFIFPMILEAVGTSPSFQKTDEAYRKRLQDKAVTLTLAQAQFSARFLDLYQYLNRRNLYPAVMKGMICRNLYPHPEQRMSSDEDLLIPEEQYEEYHKALTEYGLTPVNADTEQSEVSYQSDHLYIELHKKPFPPESKAYGDLNRFFADTESRKISEEIYGVQVYTLGHTDHLLYLICHVYKHFLNCGTGIRQISDIVLFSIRNMEKIDWELVKDRCGQIGILDFTAALYRIGEKYICSDFPKELADMWKTEESDEKPLLNDVLEGGLYGTSSEDRLHSSNVTLNAAEAAKTGNRYTAIRTLFPSYEYMKHRYEYVRKLPVLLPIGWMHRLISYGKESIFRRRKGNNAAEAMRIGSERVELMRRYGIISEKKESILKRIYERSKTSVFAPVLSPLYMITAMAEYRILNLIWKIRGERMPDSDEQEAVRKNVTFIVKSFERKNLAKGLCRNITHYYPGVRIIIADDSKEPLQINMDNVTVLHLPFRSGLSAGLKKALEQVRTPYVMRMDDDELLTVRSKVHRELQYLEEHQEIDLIGFGHTTAVRLHSPQENFREYYRQPMNDALRPLKIPHMTKPDRNHIILAKTANIYIARTEKLREVGFDEHIRVIDHHEFFWRAAGVITCAAALDTVVFHRHNPYLRKYIRYRSDYTEDLEYIRRKRLKLIRERTEGNA
ncbi:MAG: nucleotidyltransferase family protein [Solobacterium sp.]|nr:nucleotidyltransferase family protein [Solobacterium sp.]